MPAVRGRSRRPKGSYGMIILAAIVLVALLVAGRMATARFAWWKEASFSGQVVAKEARSRATDEPADDAAATEQPGTCRFYLRVGDGQAATWHEVILSAYRSVSPGDRVAKRAGTWEWQRQAPGDSGGAEE